MARARQLLITSDHTVAEIAAAVGYPDPFYFSRQFSAVNGVSPANSGPACMRRLYSNKGRRPVSSPSQLSAHPGC